MVRWGTIVGLCVLSIVMPAVLGPPQGVHTPAAVVVRPGETLWHHAAHITPPGGDVRATMDELARLNGLRDREPLLAGSTLVMPGAASATARLDGQEGPPVR